MPRKTVVLTVILVLLLVGAPSLLAKKTIPEVSDTDWSGTGKYKVAIAGEKPQKGQSEFHLQFGPQTGLEEDEFTFGIEIDELKLELPGTWSKNKKGRPLLVPDLDQAKETILDLVEDFIGFPIPGIEVEIKKAKLTARPKTSKKKGDSIKVRALLKFAASASFLGQNYRVAGKVTFKAKGAPVE